MVKTATLKKAAAAILCAAALLFGAIGVGLMNRPLTAHAESTYFSESEYTDSDRLLKSDGSLSTKRIQAFSDEVKAAEEGTSFSELTEVIPRQHLESTEENAVFSYNGAEYGYYMAKEGEFFDLLLIDFDYEFNEEKVSENEYSITIKPLLQESFKRVTDGEGNYEWKKYGEGRYKYYVANPRFISQLQNENALNYGDDGYSKYDDDGMIIQQMRANYGIIRYQTEEDALEVMGKCVLDKVVGMGVDFVVDSLNTITGGLFGTIVDLVNLGQDLYEQGKEVTISANNENNIFTELSKNEQLKDTQVRGFSRIAGFLPQQEMILSAADDSYAQCVVLLSDTNYKSRLTQACEFDIVRRAGLYDSMEHVAGNWEDENAESLFFSKRRILFEDEQPKFELDGNEVNGKEVLVYLLPEGKQVITFTPEYSGLYTAELGATDEDLTVTILDSAGNTVKNDGGYELKGGEAYSVIVGAGEEGATTSLGINFAEGNTKGTIESGEKRIFKTKIWQSDVYTLNTQNGNVLIENIFAASSDGLEEYSGFNGYTASSKVSVPLPKGEYFIVIHNSGTIKNEYELLASVCESKPIGEEISVKLDDDNFTFFKFSGMEAKKYVATLNDGEDGNYRVLDSELEPVSFDLTDSGVCYFQNYDEVIYIGLKAEKANGKFILNPTEYAFAWYIDGKLVESSQISLERGETYSLIFVINEVIQINGYSLELPDGNEYISLENNNLIISDACPTGERFRIQFRYNSVAVYDSDIEVTVKYTLNFAGIDSVNNGESLTFSWTYTEEDITEINYSLMRGTETKIYTVYTSGKTVGSTYTEDITSETKSFTEKFGEVEIKIYRVGVETSKGVEYIDFDSSESVDGTYGGGQGSAENPYLISCNRHFYNLKYNKNNNIYFKLTELLKLSTRLDMFYGHFDGGPTRIEFECNGSADLGVFQNNYGTIEGVHVEANITGNGTYCYAGGIACYNYDSGIIKDCSINFTGTFNTIKGVGGGIAAVNYGKIEDCWSSNVKVKVNGDFGGIAGRNRGSIISCYSVGTITLNIEKYNGSYQNSHVGTIVGLNDGGTVSSCYISTSDHATTIYIIVDDVDDKNLAPYVGPIYGQNDGGTVTNCWKDGYVKIETGNLHSFKEGVTKYDQTRNINDNYDV